MKDVVARALGGEGGRTDATGDRRFAGVGHPVGRYGDPDARRRRKDAVGSPAVTGAKRGGVRGLGRSVTVVALAGAVRIHRADALRVGALLVRRGIVDAVDYGLQGKALQTHDEGE